MGGETQNLLSVQPPRKHESRNRGEEHEEDPLRSPDGRRRPGRTKSKNSTPRIQKHPPQRPQTLPSTTTIRKPLQRPDTTRRGPMGSQQGIPNGRPGKRDGLQGQAGAGRHKMGRAHKRPNTPGTRDGRAHPMPNRQTRGKMEQERLGNKPQSEQLHDKSRRLRKTSQKEQDTPETNDRQRQTQQK